MKKKPYWVEVNGRDHNFCIMLNGRNLFMMQTLSKYYDRSKANQMARRLAKGLDIEFRQ